MSLPAPILAAAAYWWCRHIAPTRHHTVPRPRLHPNVAALTQISSKSKCYDISRVTTRELEQLYALMNVKAAAARSGRWRVSEAQRVVIALYCLSNYAPLRKHSILFGWSAASLQVNFHMFIDQVIEHLDAPDSRKLYAMLSVCHSLRAYSDSSCSVCSISN